MWLLFFLRSVFILPCFVPLTSGPADQYHSSDGAPKHKNRKRTENYWIPEQEGKNLSDEEYYCERVANTEIVIDDKPFQFCLELILLHNVSSISGALENIFEAQWGTQ